jgi:hypothetical protein
MSDYLGATEGELLSVSAGRRFLGYNDQRVLFPHRGQLRLEPGELVLGGWRIIPRAAISRADLTFTSAYTRGQAAGARGNAASFGLFGSLGKPLVLGLNGEDPVYLLIDFRWFTGINQARRWAAVLQEWLARP